MRLIHERGGEEIAFPLDQGETFIGRKDDCDIYFPDTSLSKRHARLVRDGDTLTLHDAGSKNGTLCNGELVRGPRRLQDGDVIQCGKLEFRVEGVGGGDFAVIDEESGMARGSRASSGTKVALASGARSASTPLAKAVRSGEVRGSVLDEFPEVPASGEPQSPIGGTLTRLRRVEGGPERAWDLTGDVITIGSKQENFIVLEGDGISRYHAEVVREGEGWVLKDLGARNGLFVAGKKIDIHELKDGDEVQIGTVKLRFEQVKASAMSGVLELLGKLKRDPVGTYKSDQRVRTAAAATVVALLLLVIAFPGGPIRSKSKPLDLQWAEEGTAKLVARDYAGAKEVFRKAQAKVATEHQELPKVLVEVAIMWSSLKDPMTFRWSKAEERLLACMKVAALPQSTRRWLETQLVDVRLNREAYDKLTEADTSRGQAAGLATEKKFREALKKYEQTIIRYSEVAPRSAFGPLAAEQSRRMREEVFQLVLAEVRGRMAVATPEWGSVIEFIGQAKQYAETSDQAAVLQQLRNECDTNVRCEQLYQRAVDIVNARNVAEYPTALRCLDAVLRCGPTVKIYQDALAYQQWIQADLLVRQAQRAYQQGDERRAFALLTQALQCEFLGPEAKNSVKTRRTSWARVVTAYNLGMEHFAAGGIRTEAAVAEFQRVIQFEPDRTNRYHARALLMLKYVNDIKKLNLEQRLKEGLEALKHDEFDNAFRFFGDVMRDENHKDVHERTIREAILDANKSRRLLSGCGKDFLHDRQERFLRIYYITKLLRVWLPPNDPQRQEAEKLFQDVSRRLNNLNKLSGQDDDPPPRRPR
jgi:pSer/pThr/pTyr-binding forkhead associated (FHA) protein